MLKREENDMRFNAKYRPERFKDVVGQEGAVDSVKGSIRKNSIQPAYLFIGESGSGKTTLARIFANSLVCRNRTEELEPCGECPACKTYKKNPSLVDIIEIDAGSDGGIDSIRNLKESLKYAPKEAYRIVIVDEAHRLSREGATALLKPIEEPPANTVFMLATTEPDKIMNTIKNRCMKLVFNKLSPDSILKRLEEIASENNIEYENEALLSIAIGCDGGLREAISLLQQLTLMVGDRKISKDDLKGLIRLEERYVRDIISLILDKNVVEIVNTIDKESDNITERDFDYFIARFRRYLYERDIDIKTSLLITSIINILVEYKNKTTYNIAPKTVLELALIESIGAIKNNDESLLWLKGKAEIQNKDAFTLLLERMNNKNDINNIKENEKAEDENSEVIDYSTNISNKEILKDKAQMFVSLMNIKFRDFEYKFKLCTAEMGDNKVLYFMVEDMSMKEELTGFLKREYSQNLKPICDIDGFIVRVR